MASFAHPKFKMAKPPCMVCRGNNAEYSLQDLGEITGLTQLVSEGKLFRNEFPKMKRRVENSLSNCATEHWNMMVVAAQHSSKR